MTGESVLESSERRFDSIERLSDGEESCEGSALTSDARTEITCGRAPRVLMKATGQAVKY
jgi:hypothetical protein